MKNSTRSWCLVVALVFVSPLATAEIFKCTTDKGITKYQNFPCPIDSIGSKATAVAPKEEPVQPAQSMPPQVQALADPEVRSRGQTRVGMTKNEVRASLGAPLKTEDPSENFDGHEIWHYKMRHGEERTVQFDKNGRVFSVQDTD